MESVKVDVSSEAGVQAAIESVSAKHGRLDILVNCAGIVGPNGKKIEDVSVDDFDRVYGTTGLNIMMLFLLPPPIRRQSPRQLQRDQTRRQSNASSQLRPRPAYCIRRRQGGKRRMS